MKKQIKKTNSVPLAPEYDLPPIKEDFRKTFQWRIFRIMAEFVEGFQFIADFKKSATIFGSSRLPKSQRYYKEAEKLGELLGRESYTVITGGGPGIMEAANKGAFEANGKSVGINIQLPEGERKNKYVQKSIGFYHFFTRKVMLSFTSSVYIFFPGGFGTLDEFFEIITLIQTKKLPRRVLAIVIGKEYWQPLFEWMKDELYLKNGTINKEHLEVFQIVDSADEAFEVIKKFSNRKK